MSARGGHPRNRTANAGELYVLDLGPAFRGYFADNCRTLAVNGIEPIGRGGWGRRRVAETKRVRAPEGAEA